MQTAIIVPVFNRRGITLRCLESLGCPDDNFIIIVVDSGSTDGTREAIREKFGYVVLLETTPDHWWTGATNTGIREAVRRHCRFVVTYNDDNVSGLDNMKALVETACKYPNAVISTVKCSWSNPDRVLFAGRRQSRWTDRSYFMDRGRNYSEIDRGLREVDWLHGQCTLFPVEVFSEVGLFDEKAFPHLYADDDLILRAKHRGYRLLVDLDIVVLNDERETGINPYYQRIPPWKFPGLLFSRKSFSQLSTKTRFLWRHRRNIFTFFMTWIADYCRLFTVIVLRWLLPESTYRKLEKNYQRRISA